VRESLGKSLAALLRLSSCPVENGPQVLGDLGGNQALRRSRVGASDSGVVGLSAQKDGLPVDRTLVDASLVCGAHVIEVVEDLVDVLFTQSTGFMLSLQGLEHW
jgi:hypothetical protein